MTDAVHGIPEALKRLEQIGEAYERGEDFPELEDCYVEALSRHPMDFPPHLDGLSESSLRKIIKGFVCYSRQYSPLGLRGSVSPCPQFFRAYANRFPEEEAALCSWIVDNRINPYEPFGTTSHNHARSLREHRGLVGNAAAITRQNIDREAERQEVRHAAKVERERAKAQKNLPKAIARGDQKAIEALLAKGAKMPSDDAE